MTCLSEATPFKHLGRGRCRGEHWARGIKWPKYRGEQTVQNCANYCGRKKGCTAFDLSGMEIVTSTGVSFLIDAAKRTRGLGGDVVLSNPTRLLKASPSTRQTPNPNGSCS